MQPDDLAAAIADGAPVDWDALAAAAATDDERRRLERFALVARISSVHAEALPADLDETASEALPDLAVGDHWGSLRIVERLAAGTFGTVYRAHDPALARDVALKILHLPVSTGRAALEAVREGQLLARVRHPNVVTVYGADERDGRVGVWMELVEGRTLEDELTARGPLAGDEVARIGHDVAHALQAVHDAGLVHRDVKTQNVMRDARDGRLVLMDFSAGREQIDMSTTAAMPATLAGSPLYLAPELLAGAPASVRSDIYSLGVLLFRMSTGRYPVEGQTLADVGEAHRRQRRVAVREARPDFPPSLAQTLDGLLSPEPAGRPVSAQDAADLLAATRRVPAPLHWWRAWPVAAMVAVASVAAGLWWNDLWPWPGAQQTEEWILVADAPDTSRALPLAKALARELRPPVPLLPPTRVRAALALMRQPAEAPMDATRAREVSLRDGAVRAILESRTARVGSGFVLTTSLVQPGDGATVATVSQDVQHESLTPADVRDHARRVDAALHQAWPTLARPAETLAKVTTSSLEAASLYTKAAALVAGDAWVAMPPAAGEAASAEALLERAIELDPDFASAWLLRSRAATLRGRIESEQLPHAQRALALVSSVSEHERYFIRGLAGRMRADQAFSRAEIEEAIRSFEALLQITPDHHWAMLELEPLYRRLDRTDEAERLALRGAEARPNSMRLTVMAARAHLARRDRGQLEAAEARAFAAASPALRRDDNDLAWLALWRASDAWLQGDASAVLAEVTRLQGGNVVATSPALARTLIQVLHGLGRFDDARRLAAGFPDRDRAFATALTDARQERWDALNPVLTPGWGDPAIHRQRFSFLYLWAGRVDDGERLLEDYRRARVRPNWQLLHQIEGELRLAQGRYGNALGLLTPVLADERQPRLRVHESAAVARRGLGDVTGAIVTLEHFDRRPATAVVRAWAGYDWLRCQLRLAEYYLEARRSRDAARVAETVRVRLRLADADHPFRQRLARLP